MACSPSFPVWVGSLRVSVKEADLHDAFVKFGTVLSCKVMHDEEGWSRKFGYVNYSRAEDAERAARNMNGKELHKATIKTKGPMMLEEEGHTKAPGIDYRPLTDCKFFVRSSMCTKGRECPYRHSYAALSSPECEAWKEWKCSNLKCPYRHPGKKGRTRSTEGRVMDPPSFLSTSTFILGDLWECRGRCGDKSCAVSYATQELLDSHIQAIRTQCRHCQGFFPSEKHLQEHNCHALSSHFESTDTASDPAGIEELFDTDSDTESIRETYPQRAKNTQKSDRYSDHSAIGTTTQRITKGRRRRSYIKSCSGAESGCWMNNSGGKKVSRSGKMERVPPHKADKPSLQLLTPPSPTSSPSPLPPHTHTHLTPMLPPLAPTYPLPPITPTPSTPPDPLEQFKLDLVKVLKATPNSVAKLEMFPKLYMKILGKRFLLANYSGKKLTHLLQALPDVVRINGEKEERTIELIDDMPDSRRNCECHIEAMLLGLPGNQISLDRFILAYEKSSGQKLPGYFGHAKLLSFLQDMPDILKITGTGSKRFLTLQPLRVFMFKITKLLNHAPGACLHISEIVPAYNKLFGKDFDAAHYGQTKLIKVLEAIPDTIRITGDDASRVVHLKKTTRQDYLSSSS